MIKLTLTESQYLALRRVISRNVKDAPEKDQEFLRELYGTLCELDLPPATWDLFENKYPPEVKPDKWADRKDING